MQHLNKGFMIGQSSPAEHLSTTYVKSVKDSEGHLPMLKNHIRRSVMNQSAITSVVLPKDDSEFDSPKIIRRVGVRFNKLPAIA